MKPPENYGPELAALTDRLTKSVGQLAQMGLADIGACDHETVLTGEGFRLLRYGSGAERADQCAVLIVYALVNRPWVLDLEPGRSTISRLLGSGMDVFLIEWEDPQDEDQDRGFSDYACRMLDECVDKVSALRGESTVNLLGVCQGGTFSLCYTALYGHKVRNLVTMVTPVDFHTADNVLSKWVRKVDLDRLVGCYGNVPGALLNALFLSLQPFR
ncbi:MAG TPA: class III poly(R)-hydroxyalkanoic acid synthase subunit PhaC, partial [Gammaproteobacteria bacterium]|nr:class III poly(R)-hydroxyalkanoic acid synthase subunit PhaC [Gammaproteobacteria bacterium]